MVSANTMQLAAEARDTLEDRDIRAIVTVGASSAAGVVAAQWITDRVMGFLSMPVEPQSAVQYGASIAVKVAVALAFGVGATMSSGLVMIGLAFAGLGALASAGVDAFVGLLETAPLGGASSAQQHRANPPKADCDDCGTSAPSPRSTGAVDRAAAQINGM